MEIHNRAANFDFIILEGQLQSSECDAIRGATIKASATGPPIEIFAVTDKGEYSLGENVTFTVSVINRTSVPLVFGPDPPNIIIEAGSEGLVKETTPGTGQVRLNYGENVTYTVVWNQLNLRGRQVPPGNYYTGVALMDITIDGQKAFNKIGRAFNILIHP